MATNETELLARLGLTEEDTRTGIYAHNFLSAIARLRDEAEAAMLDAHQWRSLNRHPGYPQQHGRDKAEDREWDARAKLADMGALLAMVLR